MTQRIETLKAQIAKFAEVELELFDRYELAQDADDIETEGELFEQINALSVVLAPMRAELRELQLAK